MAVSGLAAPYQAGYMYLGGQLKFFVFDTPGVSYLPFIRSSEMVLVEAEANYFLSNEAAARDALIELNATSGRNPEYTCNKTGDALWNDDIALDTTAYNELVVVVLLCRRCCRGGEGCCE